MKEYIKRYNLLLGKRHDIGIEREQIRSHEVLIQVTVKGECTDEISNYRWYCQICGDYHFR